MKVIQPLETKRKRAPSARALATRQRVFDAAEKVFAKRGFDGATIREIASEAGEPVGTIHHHGGGKAVLFQRTVARRAQTLSRDRIEALNVALAEDDPTLEAVVAAFILPFFSRAATDPRWHNYARIVALVSADSRWRDISTECFDPVARRFVDEIATLVPATSRKKVAEGFVFSVSAMLALLTSQHRIDALGAEGGLSDARIDYLVRFCAAGFRAAPGTP